MGGVGQGFAQGAQSVAHSIMEGMRMGMEGKRLAQQDAQFKKEMAYRLEWDRGTQGLGPSYGDDDTAATAQPHVPAFQYTEQPAQVGRVEVPGGTAMAPPPMAQPVQPQPSQPTANVGAMALIPSMRPSAMSTYRSMYRPRTR